MYELVWLSAVKREYDELSPRSRERIDVALDELKADPFAASNVKRLHGHSADYRKRVGDYRILYDVDTEKKVVRLLHIGPRDKAYS